MGLPALAVDNYGDPRTLSKWQRRQRRRGWWRSGGPLRLLLWRPGRFDERVLRSWRASSRHLRVLDTLCWPSGFDPVEIRSRVDWYLQRWVLLIHRWWSVRWWVGRAAQIAAAFVAWLALLQVARLAAGLRTWPAAVTATVGAVVAFVLFRVVFFRLANASTWYGMFLRCAPIGLALVGGGYAVTRLTWPARVWPDMAGAVLIATAGMALCYLLAAGPPALWGSIGIRRHWRRGPREDILDELLNILDDLTGQSMRNNLDRRAGWMSRLERAASTMEKRLPAILYPSDQATTSWTSERARGAATALRLLKRQIAAPADGTWDRLTAILRGEVVALASGDLGKLRWATPPSPAMVHRSRWKTAIIVLRSIVLAAAPLAVVVAVQPLLHLDAEPLRWAKVIGLAWAVLYLLFAADPTLREKIETAQSVSNLFSTTRREIDRLERRDPPEGGGGRST